MGGCWRLEPGRADIRLGKTIVAPPFPPAAEKVRPGPAETAIARKGRRDYHSRETLNVLSDNRLWAWNM